MAQMNLNLDLRLCISDETAEQCLKVLDIWQSQNPNKIIVGDKSGEYVKYKIKDLVEQEQIE